MGVCQTPIIRELLGFIFHNRNYTWGKHNVSVWFRLKLTVMLPASHVGGEEQDNGDRKEN